MRCLELVPQPALKYVYVLFVPRGRTVECRYLLWGFLCREEAAKPGHDFSQTFPILTENFITRILTLYLSPRGVHAFLPLSTSAVFFFFCFLSTSAHTVSKLLSANRLFSLSSSSQVSVIQSGCINSRLVFFLLSSCCHHNRTHLPAGATWRSHVILEFVMLEPCVGAGSEDKQGWSHRGIPRFVVGCENDECDMGQTDTGMKNDMFRGEEMDDDDESVSSRCAGAHAAE